MGGIKHWSKTEEGRAASIDWWGYQDELVTSGKWCNIDQGGCTTQVQERCDKKTRSNQNRVSALTEMAVAGNRVGA